jgi:hypothetical protein
MQLDTLQSFLYAHAHRTTWLGHTLLAASLLIDSQERAPCVGWSVAP